MARRVSLVHALDGRPSLPWRWPPTPCQMKSWAILCAAVAETSSLSDPSDCQHKGTEFPSPNSDPFSDPISRALNGKYPPSYFLAPCLLTIAYALRRKTTFRLSRHVHFFSPSISYAQVHDMDHGSWANHLLPSRRIPRLLFAALEFPSKLGLLRLQAFAILRSTP